MLPKIDSQLIEQKPPEDDPYPLGAYDPYIPLKCFMRQQWELFYCLKRIPDLGDIVPIIMDYWWTLETHNGGNRIYYGGEIDSTGPRPSRARREYSRKTALRHEVARWTTFGPGLIKLFTRRGMGPLLENGGIMRDKDAMYFAIQHATDENNKIEVKFTVNLPGCLKNPEGYYRDVTVFRKVAARTRLEGSFISTMVKNRWRIYQFEIDRKYSYKDIIWLTIIFKGRWYGSRPLLRVYRETSTGSQWKDDETDIARISDGMLTVGDSRPMTKYDLIQLFLF